MKVLLVDDDVDLLDLVTYALRREGYTVLPAVDGQQALERWEAENPDIVLLDGNLPKMDGIDVARRIRHQSQTPIIMLTARDEEEDIVQGLQVGADDYVVKPFSAKQLCARMRAVLRRTMTNAYREPASEIRVGDMVLDLQSHTVTKGGKLIPFTRLEFRIVHILALNEGRVLPYSRLIEYAWGYHSDGNPDLLKTHISRVRKKLGLRPNTPGGIKAVLGVGYTLEKI